MHAAVAIGVPVRPHGHVMQQKSNRVSARLLFCLHHDLLHSAHLVLAAWDVYVCGEMVGGCGVLHPLTVFEGAGRRDSRGMSCTCSLPRSLEQAIAAHVILSKLLHGPKFQLNCISKQYA